MTRVELAQVVYRHRHQTPSDIKGKGSGRVVSLRWCMWVSRVGTIYCYVRGVWYYLFAIAEVCRLSTAECVINVSAILIITASG